MDQMIRGRYGELESNHWSRAQANEYLNADMETVQLDDPGLEKVTRLRLLTDPGCPFYDVSYCWGVMKDGTKVRVQMPRYQFRKPYRDGEGVWHNSLKGQLIAMCRELGVHAKGIGLLDDETISRVC